MKKKTEQKSSNGKNGKQKRKPEENYKKATYRAFVNNHVPVTNEEIKNNTIFSPLQ